MGHNFVGKGKERILNRYEGHNREKLSPNSWDDMKVCDTRLIHAKMDHIHQINESGGRSHSGKEQHYVLTCYQGQGSLDTKMWYASR